MNLMSLVIFYRRKCCILLVSALTDEGWRFFFKKQFVFALLLGYWCCIFAVLTDIIPWGWPEREWNSRGNWVLLTFFLFFIKNINFLAYILVWNAWIAKTHPSILPNVNEVFFFHIFVSYYIFKWNTIQGTILIIYTYSLSFGSPHPLSLPIYIYTCCRLMEVYYCQILWEIYQRWVANYDFHFYIGIFSNEL